MADSPDLEDRADEMAQKLVGMKFGQVEVIVVEAFVGQDDEDEATQAAYLNLTLSDPVGSTWPYDDILALRRFTAQAAGAVNLNAPLYVRVAPATDHPQEDDEPSLFGA